jgi:hypothetical protein
MYIIYFIDSIKKGNIEFLSSSNVIEEITIESIQKSITDKLNMDTIKVNSVNEIKDVGNYICTYDTNDTEQKYILYEVVLNAGIIYNTTTITERGIIGYKKLEYNKLMLNTCDKSQWKYVEQIEELFKSTRITESNIKPSVILKN